MKIEHRARHTRTWYECEEEKAREMLRRTYGTDNEDWALAQLKKGNEVSVADGWLRRQEEKGG